MKFHLISSRLDDLAKAKPTPKGFVPGRRSVYWVSKLPPQPPTTEFKISTRLDASIKGRAAHKDFVPDRPSPIWPVSKAALKCPEKERLKHLAQPRIIHKQYLPDRSMPFPVSPAALKGIASERVQSLATPKKRQNFETGGSLCDICVPSVLISQAALRSIPSSRTNSLATPKLYGEFDFDSTGYGSVRKLPKHVKVSERIAQLSKPVLRKCIDDGYNPYYISPIARNAVPSPRINQLSQPTKLAKSVQIMVR